MDRIQRLLGEQLRIMEKQLELMRSSTGQATQRFGQPRRSPMAARTSRTFP